MSEANSIAISLVVRDKTKHLIVFGLVSGLCIDNRTRVEELADLFSDLFSYGGYDTISELSAVIWKDLLVLCLNLYRIQLNWDVLCLDPDLEVIGSNINKL
jgi:hypothetical protein